MREAQALERGRECFGRMAVAGDVTPLLAGDTVLDQLLVTSAADAGVDVREGFTVDGLLMADYHDLVEDGRREIYRVET